VSVLVLDVGTSALKAVVFEGDGSVSASAEAAYPRGPSPHRQDTGAWWQAVEDATRSLRAEGVAAIALTGAMENLIAVDAAGAALGEAILYPDPCGSAALDAANTALDAAGAAAIMGNPPEALMTAFKIGWLKSADPARHDAARWFLPGAKDLLALRLTGIAATDPVTATTTGLMDIGTRRWSERLTALLGVDTARLPPILPASAVIGPLRDGAAEALGLSAGIPVINGLGDAGATIIGSLCRGAGDISLYLGTSGWASRTVAAADSPVRASVYRLAHPADGLVIEITPILSAGAAGDWARAALGIERDERDLLLAEADASPGDLLFLPYLSGERFPFFDAQVRGAFLGLDSRHGRADLYYAALEGVALAIGANLATLDPDGAGPVRIVGGGARSAVWPQMIADLIGRPVEKPETGENATAAGAFLVAAEALGLEARIGAGVKRIAPRPERAGRGARMRQRFAEATEAARTLAATWR
jgi:xylulokinase